MDWSSVTGSQDVNTAYANFIDIYKNHMKKCMPMITRHFNKYKDKSNPWITRGLLKSLKTKDKLFLKLRTYSNPTVKQINEYKYKLYRNMFNKLVRVAKEKYWKNNFETAKNDINRTWNHINTLLGKSKNKHSFPEFFIDGNIKYNTSKSIANGFNNYYINVGPHLAKNIKMTHPYRLPQTDLCHTLYLTPSSPSEVISTINKMKPKW